MRVLKIAFFFTVSFVFFSCSLFILAKKEAQSLGERVHELVDLSYKRSIIRLNGDKFRQYIKATPRNYSFIIMLTAFSPHRQCIVCRYAYDEFQLVANSWRYSQINTNKLFFGTVDFDDGPDVFNSLGINSAPVFIHFPEKGKPKKGDTMDIQRTGFQAETIAKWITERTDIHITVFRRPNYSRTIELITLFVLIGALLYMRRNNLDFLYNRTTWGLASLCIVLAMTSGQMWNHVRSPPFIHRSSRGTVDYVHSSSGAQFIIETYIVMILNAAIVLGFILLQEAGSSRGDPRRRKVMACTGLALIVVFYPLLLSIFKMKAQGYPFSFLLN